MVHLLDEMIRILPEGLYIKSLRQSGSEIELIGYAQSSARVSTYMRALDETPLFQDPALVEVDRGEGPRAAEHGVREEIPAQEDRRRALGGELGLKVEFTAGEGPVIRNPVREPADVDRVLELAPREATPGTAQPLSSERPNPGRGVHYQHQIALKMRL